MRLASIFYGALNVAMRPLLRSSLHGKLIGNLCILSYTGRKSGRAYSVPLSYMRQGSTLRFMSSRETRWWHNLRPDRVDVEVELGDTRLPGRARAFVGDSEALRQGVEVFLTAVPRDARVYRIGLDAQRRPIPEQIAAAADRLVLVEVELEGSETGEL